MKNCTPLARISHGYLYIPKCISSIMKSYEKLAFIYNKDWGSFSLEYLKIINAVKKKVQAES